jgi:ubiquinone/menaquinone biosynthesis C-methylase UbiE|tara:strand:- start:4482 stop:5039 length:558 start_codon:yes stop_codon:yes gene_type:complete
MNPYQLGELRPMKRIVEKMLVKKKFDSVLEVGAQWGENLVAIRERFPEKKLVGIDLDVDNVITEARTVTGLDLRIGNVLDLNLGDNEFDVVFTNALFCMLRTDEIERGFQEIIRVARKHIILVELETSDFIGISWGERIGANWVEMFKKYGLKATRRKIPEKVWDVNPWLSKGYIYYAKVGGKKP